MSEGSTRRTRDGHVWGLFVARIDGCSEMSITHSIGEAIIFTEEGDDTRK